MTGGRWRRSTTVAVVTLGLAASTACGIGDKQALADQIHGSRQAVADASPAIGTLHLELETPREASNGAAALAAAAGAPGATGPSTLTLQISLDGTTRRARAALDDPAVERAALFDDTQVFVRRQNARPTERRTWARLDLADLVETERPITADELEPPQILAGIAATLNPVYLVELVEGALAGSVERRGTEPAGGIDAVRYDANISFDKALTELDFDDEAREVRMRLFHLLGAREDVVPASIWLDPEGRLRKLRLELDQRIDRRRSNTLVATLELHGFGGEAALEHPAGEATVTYERFGRLVRSALPTQA
jgi:hypothetical protein